MEFEIHITVSDFSKEKKEPFIAFCRSQGVKPVIIVLDKGNYINQPMITGIIECDNFEEANKEIEQLSAKFHEEGFTVVRKKVEISPKEESYFYNPIMKNGKPYYEWHGKVEADDLEMVKNLCEGHGGHLSRNSLSSNGKTRFVTLRDYEGSVQFYERVKNIHRVLGTKGIEFLEEEYELCIYDTKEELDSGWI